MPLLVAIAGLELESASFLPGLTSVEVFEASALRGEAMGALRGANSAVGGFIDVCEGEGVAWQGIVHASAGAAGMAADEAFDRYLAEVLAALEVNQGRFDGLLLFLHGAMVTPTRPAADLEFIRAVRAAAGPEFPIAVAMDLHANVSEALTDEVAIVCGYHESPHVDMGQTGERAARLLVSALRGECRPVASIVKPGVVLPSIFTATSLTPLRSFVDESINAPANHPTLLDASLFLGFAYADAPDCGAAVVAIADGDGGIAHRFAADLATRYHAARHALFRRELVHTMTTGLDHATALAATAAAPVVVLEHADRVNDSTWCARALLERPDVLVAVPYVWDPESAARAHAAGAGNDVDLALGGHSSPQAGGPLDVRARVLWAGHKNYTGTGPMRRGAPVSLGLCALIQVGNLTVSVTSRSESAVDLDAFEQFGLDADDFDIVLLRSKTHFRAAWEPVAADIVIIDTPDWGPADLTTLPYRHVAAGVYPISAQ